MTIRVKLASTMIPLAVISILVVALLSRRVVKRIVLRDISFRAAGLAASFAQRPGVQAGIAGHDEKALRPILREALHDGASYAAALDADDRVVAHTDVSQRGSTYHPVARARHLNTGRGPVIEASANVQARIHPQRFDLFAPAPPTRRDGTVIVAMPIGAALRTASRIERQVGILVAVIMACMIALAVLFIDRTLKPIAKLAEGTRRVAEGDLGGTVEVRTSDELGQLADSFNAMSRRLSTVAVSKDFLDNIVETMLDGLIVTDSSGAVALVNPSASRALDLSDVSGLTLAEILPEAEAARAAGAAVANREGKLRARARELPVLFSLSALRGRRGGWALTFKDISDLKSAEKSLEAKAGELKRSNEELEQFAYVASHDLQEPLRKVANFTQLLARRYQGKLDNDADEFIGYIIDGTLRMRDMIQDMLAYSRAGATAALAQPVDLNAVVARAAADVEQARVEAQGRIEIGPLPTVPGDAARLTQAFENLLSNGLKFRAPGRPPVLKVDAAQEPRAWRISVEDNGIGIEPRFRDRVFVLFQRLHTRREYPGTGIGLAIVRKVVETHGGRVWIEDADGPGTRFVIELPKAGPQTA